jgi:hypothetical protein
VDVQTAVAEVHNAKRAQLTLPSSHGSSDEKQAAMLSRNLAK